MKKFVRKVQHLGQKAAEFRQVLESVPPRVSEIRDTVLAVSGQVQRLRSEIATTLAPLRAENDTQLVTTLREIEGSAEVLAEAGFRLLGVDMDMGAHRRLTVRLQRREDVAAARLRSLLAVNATRPVVKTLLTALLQADELADQIELSTLRYTDLVIDIGLIPSVRMGWRSEEVMIETEEGETTESKASATSGDVEPVAGVPDASAAGGAGSAFFQRRAPAAGIGAIPPLSVPDPAPPPMARAPAVIETRPSSGAGLSGDWKVNALDRFKKMPDLSRRSR